MHKSWIRFSQLFNVAAIEVTLVMIVIKTSLQNCLALWLVHILDSEFAKPISIKIVVFGQ